jgi:hypothetical protein
LKKVPFKNLPTFVVAKKIQSFAHPNILLFSFSHVSYVAVFVSMNKFSFFGCLGKFLKKPFSSDTLCALRPWLIVLPLFPFGFEFVSQPLPSAVPV